MGTKMSELNRNCQFRGTWDVRTPACRQAGGMSYGKRALIILCLLLSAGMVAGCAGIKESLKQVAGISTQEIEAARPTAVVKTLEYEYDECFKKTEEALKSLGSYIYRRDQPKGMLALYVSDLDTTPVGIFFKIVDSTHTQLEIASPSSYTQESMAAKISLALEESKSDLRP